MKILFKCTTDNCTADYEFGTTPLMNAAQNAHEDVVRVLLEGGANVDRVDGDGETALHIAAMFGHPDICRLLLDWGAKVDTPDKGKFTPLHNAAWFGNLSVVKLLVERGADVRLKNVDGKTASDLALSREYKEIADWLDSRAESKEP